MLVSFDQFKPNFVFLLLVNQKWNCSSGTQEIPMLQTSLRQVLSQNNLDRAALYSLPKYENKVFEVLTKLSLVDNNSEEKNFKIAA